MYCSSACAEAGYCHGLLVAMGNLCFVTESHYRWNQKQKQSVISRFLQHLHSSFVHTSAHVPLSFLVMCCHCVSAPLRKEGKVRLCYYNVMIKGVLQQTAPFMKV